MIASNPAELIEMIRNAPTKFDPAPDHFVTMDVVFRKTLEDHVCVLCHDPATSAYVASTAAGNRWLDMCAAHERWLTSA